MDYPEQDQEGVNKRQRCEQDTKIHALKVVNDVCNTLSVQSQCQELMMKGLRAAKREERFAFFKQFAQEKPMVHKDLVLEILKMGFGGMATGVELFNKDAKEFLEPFICVMKTKDPAMVQQAVIRLADVLAKMCSEKSMVLRSNLTVTQWLWVFDSTVSFLSSKNPTNPFAYERLLETWVFITKMCKSSKRQEDGCHELQALRFESIEHSVDILGQYIHRQGLSSATNYLHNWLMELENRW